MYDDLIAAGLIGTDEAGKGDYFGPLVCAACYVDANTLPKLNQLGVKDSKKLSNGRVLSLADSIKKLCPYNVVAIGPEKYNQLYTKMKNLNRLLAWSHARAIENLLGQVDCQNVLTDQFGDERFIQRSLLEKGKKVNLIQRPKAEMNQAVAAASILARAGFLTRLERLSAEYGLTLQPGAGDPTDKAIALFIEKHGQEKLPMVAKVHFKNTRKVLSKIPGIA